MKIINFYKQISDIENNALEEVKKFFIENNISELNVNVATDFDEVIYVQIGDNEEVLSKIRFENGFIFFATEENGWCDARNISHSNYIKFYDAIVAVANIDILSYFKFRYTLNYLVNEVQFSNKEIDILRKMDDSVNIDEFTKLLFEKALDKFINEFTFYKNKRDTISLGMKTIMSQFYKHELTVFSIKKIFNIDLI